MVLTQSADRSIRAYKIKAKNHDNAQACSSRVIMALILWLQKALAMKCLRQRVEKN